ncbi:bifunctional diaminohydroxyphosphoribosylaminopyrimidine deaminase/5-amino-6-(5-phosphoribosylamino)uracil reductase RibD [Aeoliella straminimaris]|nr:bifunctional diaminohydroxyphosphoribosylaminopyrimidine deaminase/5-amino-6-(5-phosphoribosylamino)uracil reductase RibD [Aeoliella straminimaris]
MTSLDSQFMARALQLARQGEGHVEPNPMVGAVVVADGQIVGEGWHQKFGGPHAEVNALAAAGPRARGATLYVTLEPCCHTGKTPPCSQAVIEAGIARVVAAVADPFPQVDGGGFYQLRNAGVTCEIGLMQQEARHLLAPYLKLVTTGRPWVIAKWAMTLDGKIATHTGSSQWITGTKARQRVHQLRGRMDAIIVGSRTARVDNPLLTARPPGVRRATRIVLGHLDPESQLANSAHDAPLIVVRPRHVDPSEYHWLTATGGELLLVDEGDHITQMGQLLDQLGERRMTNVMFEGGAVVLGALFDAHVVDEVHAYVAPKITGGSGAPSPVSGFGACDMNDSIQLEGIELEQLENDLFIHGRVKHSSGTVSTTPRP